MRCLFISLALIWALPVAAQDVTDLRRLTVTGEGRVEAPPDMATLSMGVQTEARTAARALSDNSEAMAQVLAQLRAADIAERDLQTSGLSLSPRWERVQSTSGQTQRVVGYVASNQLTVRVRALETLGGLIDTVVGDGANRLNGLQFATQEPGPLRDEARRRAVADARAKAELYAAAAGVALGDVLAISEPGFSAAPQQMLRMDAEMATASVPVAAGEVSLRAQITIVYEIAN